MSEQQMPARIWCEPTDHFWESSGVRGGTVFIRSDIAERMAEALEAFVPPDGSCHCDWITQEKARSALSAFRSATQDTENSR